MPEPTVRMGAVAYDPKVVTIWEGMREYFLEMGIVTDYVLFSSYEAQVDALLNRQIDVAWNTPAAYVRCQLATRGDCLVLAMRNTDVDFTTRLLARRDSGIKGIEDLRGKRMAVGSADSAQSAILPLHYLREMEMDPDRDLTLLRFDLDLGKHGDTGTSELEVLRALHEGSADAGAIGHVTWLGEVAAGHVNTDLVRSVWTSPPYCHCNFTALPDLDPKLAQRWTEALFAMEYNHPKWHRIMELEGLTAWVPGRKEGYETLTKALSQSASP